jgi:hypothetical protein
VNPLTKFWPEATWTVMLALVVYLVLWIAASLAVYRRFRGAAWLAGSTACQCLLALGIVAGTGYFLPRLVVLAPLGAGIALLVGLHLRAAEHAATSPGEAIEIEADSGAYTRPNTSDELI